MCLLILTVFSGERCGPWASCLSYPSVYKPQKTTPNKYSRHFSMFIFSIVELKAINFMYKKNKERGEVAHWPVNTEHFVCFLKFLF